MESSGHWAIGRRRADGSCDGSMTQSLDDSMETSSDQIREKRVELILQQLEDVPALPPAAAGVIPVPPGKPAAVADAVTLLGTDAELSSRVLRLLHVANVPSLGAAGAAAELDSIDRVMARRGFETLRLAVTSVGVFGAFATA